MEWFFFFMSILRVRTSKGQYKPKRDAQESLSFKVTRRHITKSKRKEVMQCALAVGCSFAKDVISAKVGRHCVYIERKKFWERYSIDNETRRMIDAFDSTGYFRPGVYTFYPPYIKLGPATSHPNKPRDHGRRGKHVFRKAPVRHIVKHVA